MYDLGWRPTEYVPITHVTETRWGEVVANWLPTVLTVGILGLLARSQMNAMRGMGGMGGMGGGRGGPGGFANGGKARGSEGVGDTVRVRVRGREWGRG